MIECRKTKTKVITMANQKKEKSIQSTQSKTDKTRENKARENAGDQAVIDLVLHLIG